MVLTSEHTSHVTGSLVPQKVTLLPGTFGLLVLTLLLLPHLMDGLFGKPVGSLLASERHLWNTVISNRKEQVLKTGSSIFNIITQEEAVPGDLTEKTKSVEISLFKFVGKKVVPN